MKIKEILDPKWFMFLENELDAPYFEELVGFLRGEEEIYPPENLVFNAFNQTPLEKVRVVVVGQDPYHAPGQAHGLSFSVPEGVCPPPSLKNIFKELKRDLGKVELESGCLLPWARQGVLLLNATLTVKPGEAASHQSKGWERFTDAVLRLLASGEKPLIFVLWGKSAQKKADFLNENKHVVLKANHPSPLSAHRGFLGCGHFSKINEQLVKWGELPVDWKLTKP